MDVSGEFLVIRTPFPLSTMESSHNRSLAPNPTHRDTHAESRVEPSKQSPTKADEHSHARRRQERDVQEVWPGVAGMGLRIHSRIVVQYIPNPMDTGLSM